MVIPFFIVPTFLLILHNNFLSLVLFNYQRLVYFVSTCRSALRSFIGSVRSENAVCGRKRSVTSVARILQTAACA